MFKNIFFTVLKIYLGKSKNAMDYNSDKGWEKVYEGKMD